MQLRDAETSELIAEGTPLEIATLAAELDPADVLFDDAGGVDRKGRSTFDPAAVRAMRADEIAGLEAILAELPATPPADVVDKQAYRDRRASIRDTIAERRARIAAGKDKAIAARQAMRDARARVRG